MTRKKRRPLPPEFLPVVESFREKTLILAREAVASTEGSTDQAFREAFWVPWTQFFGLYMSGIGSKLDPPVFDALYFELSQLGATILTGGPGALPPVVAPPRTLSVGDS
jgi:hypothetical protein